MQTYLSLVRCQSIQYFLFSSNMAVKTYFFLIVNALENIKNGAYSYHSQNAEKGAENHLICILVIIQVLSFIIPNHDKFAIIIFAYLLVEYL